jgi:hypothetical protein
MTEFVNESKELLQIKQRFVDKLPEELVRKIYKDYLETEVYYDIYKKIIVSNASISLDIKDLLPFIPLVLSKPHICLYISKKCHGFCSSYKEHKIENTKIFVLMKKGESFAATILFSLYH